MRTGVNFTNILQAAFTLADPKSALKSSSFLRFRDLRGVKAAHKHVDEIDPDYINKWTARIC